MVVTRGRCTLGVKGAVSFAMGIAVVTAGSAGSAGSLFPAAEELDASSGLEGELACSAASFVGCAWPSFVTCAGFVGVDAPITTSSPVIISQKRRIGGNMIDVYQYLLIFGLA